MKLRTMRRHVRDAFRAVWRNRWMSLAAVSTVAVALFLVGVFAAIALNVQHLTEQMERQVEIRLFLKDGTGPEAVAALEAAIRAMPEVADVRFIPKDEGLRQLKADYKDMADLFDGLEEDNPLPDAFVVKTKSPEETATVAERLAARPEVETIRYGKEWIDVFFQTTAFLRRAMLVIVAGLVGVATFLIANTIRLTIVHRRDEIEVMRLVGATRMYIRWPFFIEGAFIGLAGALLPLGALAYGYDALLTRIRLPFVTLLPFSAVAEPLAALIVGLGFGIGVVGTLASIRKFLRV
ncbi:permease-like cell division protein FtsX [Hydrogenibacillus schlegelii]|uniref:Cell division protein FtsX n=1 Tax=Hydrogenibacillus schlegelii TaxID=1484 RepID=A0A132NCE0_HYDSH|nr:permease-like cell division protein FtsX [Hydrogenibacillus schlegelii]KWX07805.1 cell division protein FtsX [Hydrogenibacillus schlegelii]MBT9281213.1 permease-like cell division protein FtsX [Hydrogenibacillus schlegelii]OAR03573.1 cell division protein FtsX [Hydrogenibacillus schlegelii]PTQ54231.1 MAG: Cell division protein FtsX [Hydrogenibacillus schlegelii]